LWVYMVQEGDQMATQTGRSHDVIQRYLATSPAATRIQRIPISAVREGDELIVAMDLPGVRETDVDVTVDGHVLEVKAYRRPPQNAEGESLIDEHRYGEVRRQLRLASIYSKVSHVGMDSGVLTVTILVDRDQVQSSAVSATDILIEEPTLAPDALLDTLIEATATHAERLEEFKRLYGDVQHDTVSLTTPTGILAYKLPLSRDQAYSSQDVGKILSPSGQGHRSIAQHRRQSNELLGIKVANKYLYPKFQIDAERREIIPVVKYANTLLECDADPWGVLDWWYSEDEALDDRRPVDMVKSGELTTQLVDFAIDSSQQGME
jgi:HSP20 family molecular chaperone IbpA